MQVSNEFQNNIKLWTSIDDKIKSANDVVKNLKQEKEKLSGSIMVYMEQQNIANQPINITGGQIKIATSKSTQSASSQKYIEARLTQYFKSASKGKEATDFIFDKSVREVTEKPVLRRTKRKVN